MLPFKLVIPDSPHFLVAVSVYCVNTQPEKSFVSCPSKSSPHFLSLPPSSSPGVTGNYFHPSGAEDITPSSSHGHLNTLASVQGCRPTSDQTPALRPPRIPSPAALGPLAATKHRAVLYDHEKSKLPHRTLGDDTRAPADKKPQ